MSRNPSHCSNAWTRNKKKLAFSIRYEVFVKEQRVDPTIERDDEDDYWPSFSGAGR